MSMRFVRSLAGSHRNALALALAAGLGFTGIAHGQATTGSIFGTVPAAEGETVLIQSANGLSREVPVDAGGHYAAGNLPLGNYTVSLRKDGATIDSRRDVTLIVGAGTQVSFGSGEPAGTTTLSGLTVTASSLPAIDVTQVDSRTVVTAEQLAKLPLQRTAEAIATLAPGVNAGSGYFTSPTGQVLNSFGGSSIAENAYYINGFNTTDPLHNFGGLTLPYGAIDQEQVLTGGYGAAYGRSDGGVISQVGKRGTNEWHFGGQVLWQPAFAAADPVNAYYPSGPQFLSGPDGRQGQIYQYRNRNKSSTATYDAYVGGPLIKDKLFLFAAVEGEKQYDGRTVASVNTGEETRYSYSDPKWYAKVDWNITDSNILELTGASNKTEYQGNVYAYDYASGQRGAFKAPDTETKDGADLWVAKYTGYITDDLTVEALYGKMVQTDYSQASASDAAYIYTPENENPAYTGGALIRGPQTVGPINNPDAQDRSSNLRLDVTYKLGDHTITAGIDNMDVQSLDIGQEQSGPGYSWEYGKGDPNVPISTLAGAGVGAPGGDGYYVSQYIYTTGAASVRVKQRAQYIEDQWQVSQNVLLSLGLRTDQFTNYNPGGVAYLRLTSPQWAPRLGASWDVFGDSTLKVYGNAGRYYLDEPTNVAIRGASGSTYTNQYFTYTGIDPQTGAPTGLVQIPQDHYPGVSSNLEYGQLPDPHTVTSKNAKSEYQDEYILGFDKSLGSAWTLGAKATYRKLGRDLDDVCDYNVFADEGQAQGFDPAVAAGSGCFIMNPGANSTFNVPDGSGGYGTMTIPWSAFGMPDLMRKYLALSTYLEHPFDGKWYGRVDYTLSHSFGNTEGSVRSDIGQQDVSTTEDWDNRAVMAYSGGDQAMDRRHQLKFIGYYQLTPEWLVGATMQVLSGTPKMCLGYFGPQQDDPYGYNNNPGNNAYHFCGPSGTPAPLGSTGRTPWQEIVSLNASYRPAWAAHKLAFNVLVYNLLNQQEITQFNPNSEEGAGVVNTSWQLPLSYETPRYVQFGVSYDF